MKKNKRTPTATETVATAAVENHVPDDIKNLIRECTVFFDNLIDQIPAKFYLPTADEDKVYYQGLSKSAKSAAKLKSIENTKKARRDRLDPEKSTTTTEVLKETLENETKKVDDNGREGVTLEDLHQKLQRRIAELRAARGGDGDSKREADRIERKRKRSEYWEGKKNGESEEGGKAKENERDEIEKVVSEAVKGIEFGKVKLASEMDDVSHKRKKKKKLSKEEELKRALELEAAKKDPEKGEFVAKKHAWKAATERAMGNKVHDNPKLLKQSIQKDKRKHEKSVEKWKNRTDTTRKMKHDKQEKRKGNIKAKIDRKKQNKIEKREKKLMRPGFEGRKEGFVNTG